VRLRRSNKKRPLETKKTLSVRYAEVVRLRQAIARTQSPLKASVVEVNVASK
jgi:hypothetical protein